MIPVKGIQSKTLPHPIRMVNKLGRLSKAMYVVVLYMCYLLTFTMDFFKWYISQKVGILLDVSCGNKSRPVSCAHFFVGVKVRQASCSNQINQCLRTRFSCSSPGLQFPIPFFRNRGLSQQVMQVLSLSVSLVGYIRWFESISV